MAPAFSLYLDLVRFVAALAVLIYHANLRALVTEPLPLSGHGHAAVVVFFVLSGFVVAWITDTRERSAQAYLSSRFARLYSVALLAVLLTPLLDLAGQALNPVFYEGKTTHDYAWLRIISSLVFMNESWFVSIMSFSNVPYWSLCYEMWYYILFAVAVFCRGKTRAALLLLIAALIGPKILLLLPVWWTGVWLYQFAKQRRLPESLGWLFFLGSLFLYAAFQHYGVTESLSLWLKSHIGEEWHKALTFSKFFVGDYLLALIVALNFAGFHAIAFRFESLLMRVERPIRRLAMYTFALYLLHQPLLQFFAALIPGDPEGYSYFASVMLLLGLAVLLIGNLAEQWRKSLRTFFLRSFSWPMIARVFERLFVGVRGT